MESNTGTATLEDTKTSEKPSEASSIRSGCRFARCGCGNGTICTKGSGKTDADCDACTDWEPSTVTPPKPSPEAAETRKRLLSHCESRRGRCYHEEGAFVVCSRSGLRIRQFMFPFKIACPHGWPLRLFDVTTPQ